MIQKFLNRFFGHPAISDPPVIECCLTTCSNRTTRPESRDVRERWIVGVKMKDEDGNEHTVNFCPRHIREYLGADSDFYDRTERTERFVREKILEN